MYFHPFEMIQQRRHIVGGFLLILLQVFVIFGYDFSVEFVVGWKIWVLNDCTSEDDHRRPAPAQFRPGVGELHGHRQSVAECFVFFSHPKSMVSGEYIPRFRALQYVQW